MGVKASLAIVCDSTNVFRRKQAGSEGVARKALVQAVAEQSGKVAITSFASNVALACNQPARRRGRMIVRFCLVGRSMIRIVAAAQSVGLLKEFSFVDPEDAAELPDEHVLYLHWKPGRAEMPRSFLGIARGDHPSVKMGEGDTVHLFSRASSLE